MESLVGPLASPKIKNCAKWNRFFEKTNVFFFENDKSESPANTAPGPIGDRRSPNQSLARNGWRSIKNVIMLIGRGPCVCNVSPRPIGFRKLGLIPFGAKSLTTATLLVELRAESLDGFCENSAPRYVTITQRAKRVPQVVISKSPAFQ